MSASPYPVSLIFQSSDETALSNVVVTLRNINNNEYVTQQVTNASGQVILGVDATSTDYEFGDFIEVLAYKEGYFAIYRFVANNSESEDATITMQTITYTSPQDIADFLGLSKMFKMVVTEHEPNIVYIAKMINDAEDEIDTKTMHAWRTRYCSTASNEDNTAKYEYHTPNLVYRQSTGIPIFLEHRKIKTLDADEGDALGIWTGSDYDDWIANKSEGRGNDYWFDYEQGILWMRWEFLTRHSNKVRIKYRYGEEKVNKLVEDIAKKIVCVDLVANDDRINIIAGGEGRLSIREKIETWKKDIDKGIEELTEFTVINPDMSGYA